MYPKKEVHHLFCLLPNDIITHILQFTQLLVIPDQENKNYQANNPQKRTCQKHNGEKLKLIIALVLNWHKKKVI